MSMDLMSEQAEIINEFLLESREMLDQLEPAIIELGQSCQNVDCWATTGCSNVDCSRHGQSLDMPCWLEIGYIDDGLRTCVHASSAEECRSCQVFQCTNGNGETMNAIFRLFHSMKGSAGFLELDNISRVAHAAESLLDLIRSGKIALRSEHVNLLCQSCDFAREAMEQVENSLEDTAMQQAADTIAGLLGEAADAALARLLGPQIGGAEPAVGAADIPGPEPVVDDEAFLKMLVSPEMLERFVQEADELLQHAEQALLAWTSGPLEAEGIGELFRHVHSFKGNCGFFGFKAMEKLSHQMETVLDWAKEERPFSGGHPAETLLQCVDLLRDAVAEVAQGGAGTIADLDQRLAELGAHLLDAGNEAAAEVAPTGAGSSAAFDSAPPAEPARKGIPTESDGADPAAEESTDLDDRLLGEILVEEGLVDAAAVDAALACQRKPIGELLVEQGKVQPAQLSEALARQKRSPAPVKPAAGEAAKSAAPVNRQDIRVELSKLDDLINLIGEMVIAENMLLRSPDLEGLQLDNFNKAAQQMSKLVRDLQEMAMVIRMVPVSGLFRRMIRLVHDLSLKSGKKVDLQLFGQETEIDKTVIEQISDPLVHLLRNSLDHGLEPPQERLAAGKPEKGLVKLSARHQEGEVWIEVEDDGRGLNREKIIAKARSKGLIRGTGEQLSDKEVYNLIFQPGFSTADQITDVSGRGVGMDVVKKNLEKIKGKIEVTSVPGRGTRILLRIPLTLAIIDGMLVRIGKAKCIVPLLSIREIFRPIPDAVTIMPDGQELVRVRDNFYPVRYLDRILQEPADYQGITDGVLVVLEYQNNHLCLLVDEILGQQQTVVKGLSDFIGTVRIASGCTILGNGEVCLILDVATLVEESAGRVMLQAQGA